MEPPLAAPASGPPDLTSAFLVYDDYYENESSDTNFIIPYFYPPTVSPALRWALLSAASSVINLARNYATAGDGLSVLALENSSKLAFKSIGIWTMVLTAPASQPDAVLLGALNLAHTAFMYYHGSFDKALADLPATPPKNADVSGAAMSEIRGALMTRMAALCAPLVPLIRLPALAPLPLAELPRHSSRLFLLASQTACAVRTLHPQHQGTLVTFDAGVLCTELDGQSTRLVCNLIEHESTNDASMARAAQRSWLASDTHDGGTPEPDIHVQCLYPLTGGDVSLLLISFSHLSLALLLPTELAADPQHIALIRSSFDVRLYSLEAAIQRQRREAPTSAHVYRSIAVASPSTQALSSGYSSLRYDLSTGAARATGPAFADTELTPAPTTATAFLNTVDLMHCLVSRQGGPTEVLLRDHTGAMYARRALDREVYVHAPIGTTSVERWMEQFGHEVQKADLP